MGAAPESDGALAKQAPLVTRAQEKRLRLWKSVKQDGEGGPALWGVGGARLWKWHLALVNSASLDNHLQICF